MPHAGDDTCRGPVGERGRERWQEEEMKLKRKEKIQSLYGSSLSIPLNKCKPFPPTTHTHTLTLPCPLPRYVDPHLHAPHRPTHPIYPLHTHTPLHTGWTPPPTTTPHTVPSLGNHIKKERKLSSVFFNIMYSLSGQPYRTMSY